MKKYEKIINKEYENSLGYRISYLRTANEITQEQLAKKMYISSKDVQSIENNSKEPSLTEIVTLSKIFNVTTDYLISAREVNYTKHDNEVTLSIIEKCAKYDDLSLYEIIKNNYLTATDHKNKNLLTYVTKYQTLTILNQMFNDKNLYKFVKMNTVNPYSGYKGISDLLFYSSIKFDNPYITDINPIITLNIIESPYDVDKKSKPVYLKDAIKYETISKMLKDDATSKKLFEYIKLPHNKENNVNDPDVNIYWIQGIYAVISSLLTTNRVAEVEDILNWVLEVNTSTNNKVSNLKTVNPRNFVREHTLRQDGIYINKYQNNIIGQYVKIPEKILTYALKIKLYDICSKMNDINTISNGYVLPGYDIFSSKLEDDKMLSQEDREIQEITFDGIVDAKRLLALDNKKLYMKYIQLPGSIEEKGLLYIKQKNYKELINLASKTGFIEIIKLINTEDTNSISKTWSTYFKPNNNVEFIRMDSSLLNERDRYGRPLDRLTLLEKNKCQVKFREIINHKDKYFFKLAIKSDPNNINWALENIDPSRFDIIKLLLDNGAMLIQRYADDGYGYPYESVDKIGTEILKKKINDVLGGK